MHRLRHALMAAGLLAAVSTGAHASLIAYDNTVTTSLQNYGGSLGMDFTVNGSITVSQLGVFDNGDIANLIGHDGRSGVSVAIFDSTTHAQVSNAITFTPANAGAQVNANAFQSIAPLTLTSGTYTIVAANDVNFNSYGATNASSTTNDGDGAVTFGGTSRFTPDMSPALVFPSVADTGPANRYDAGTFVYDVPEPASMLVIGAGLVGAHLIRRRRN